MTFGTCWRFRLPKHDAGHAAGESRAHRRQRQTECARHAGAGHPGLRDPGSQHCGAATAHITSQNVPKNSAAQGLPGSMTNVSLPDGPAERPTRTPRLSRVVLRHGGRMDQVPGGERCAAARDAVAANARSWSGFVISPPNSPGFALARRAAVEAAILPRGGPACAAPCVARSTAERGVNAGVASTFGTGHG